MGTKIQPEDLRKLDIDNFEEFIDTYAKQEFHYTGKEETHLYRYVFSVIPKQFLLPHIFRWFAERIHYSSAHEAYDCIRIWAESEASTIDRLGSWESSPQGHYFWSTLNEFVKQAHHESRPLPEDWQERAESKLNPQWNNDALRDWYKDT